MSDPMEQFRRTFREESHEALDVMESVLVSTGAEALGPEQLAGLFRAAHSIKGGAGTFGFTPISEFVHAVETLLDQLREGQRTADDDIRQLLLESVDCTRTMLDALAAGHSEPAPESAELTRRLEAVLAAPLASSPAADALPPAGAQPAPATAAPAADAAAPGWTIEFRPRPDLLRSGNEPTRILREIAELGELRTRCDSSALPALEELVPEECYLGWQLQLSGAIPREKLDEVFAWVETECDLWIGPLAGRAATQAAETQPLPPAAESGPGSDPAPAPAAESTPSGPVELDPLVHEFLVESRDNLDLVEQRLLAMGDESVDRSPIDEIFRAIHTIKGTSGFLNMPRLSMLTHAGENLLSNVREGLWSIDRPTVDTLLAFVDAVRSMLDHIEATGVEPTPDHELLIDQLNRLKRYPVFGEILVNTGKCTREQVHSALAAQKSGDPRRLGEILVGMGAVTAQQVIEVLRLQSSTASQPVAAGAAPASSAPPPTPSRASASASPAAAPPDTATAAPAPAQPSTPAPAPPVAPPAVPAAKPAPPQAASEPAPRAAAPRPGAARSGGGERRGAPPPADSSSIRVGIDKVDALVNMVGELVITQSMLGQIGKDFEMERLDKLKDGLTQLERNTRELQEAVMRIRMLPIHTVFQRFTRLVHDLSAKLGKKVELTLSGEHTELDKTVLEKISDPLVHLVRNSLDHGVEPPDARREAGKTETAHVHLSACHQGGNVVIEISDDGAGINTDRVLEKARAAGIVDPRETLSEERIADLIFHPGLSTAAQVSDVSGRGVGMDVVRRNIKDLGGSVEIASRRGLGTTVRVRLPLTLAILDGQLVRVAGETYIMPLVSIVESLSIQRGSVNVVAGRSPLYRLRESYIPIVQLDALFGLGDPDVSLEGRFMVVVEAEGRRVGLVIDELLDQQQVVIKSLERNYRRVSGLSGGTILGDGTVALILDVSGIVDSTQRGAGAHNPNTNPSQPTAPSAQA